MSIVNDPNSADAYSFPKRNYFHGRWIRYCGWWPDRIIRLVRKSKGSFQVTIHHGKWTTMSRLKYVDVPINHYSFTSYSNMLSIMDKRSTNMARELFDVGRRANVLTPFLHGIMMFLKTYIIKLGFLEGFNGFVIAITKAGGSFFKYAKLIELQRKNKK